MFLRHFCVRFFPSKVMVDKLFIFTQNCFTTSSTLFAPLFLFSTHFYLFSITYLLTSSLVRLDNFSSIFSYLYPDLRSNTEHSLFPFSSLAGESENANNFEYCIHTLFDSKRIRKIESHRKCDFLSYVKIRGLS